MQKLKGSVTHPLWIFFFTWLSCIMSIQFLHKSWTHKTYETK